MKPGGALVVVVIAVMALTGCGGSSPSDDQVVGSSSSYDQLVELPLDVGSVEYLVGQSDAAKAIDSVYRVSYEARDEKDVHKRAAMLRERIPPFVDMFEADYQPTIDKLEALELKTAAGDELRSIEIDIIKEWEKALSTLRTDLATSDSAWQAWVTFDDTKNDMADRFGQRLNTYVANLPAPEQQMLRQTVAQTFRG